jgi:hypothetical protein
MRFLYVELQKFSRIYCVEDEANLNLARLAENIYIEADMPLSERDVSSNGLTESEVP